MITSKQRAFLAGIAQRTDAIFQIGKGGINDEMVVQIGEALDVRELVKITVLKSARDEQTPKSYLQELADRLHAEPVQAVGGKITLYRAAPEKPKIDLLRLQVNE